MYNDNRDNDSVRAELMHIGQTADFPPELVATAVAQARELIATLETREEQP